MSIYSDTSLKTSRVDWSALFSPRRRSLRRWMGATEPARTRKSRNNQSKPRTGTDGFLHHTSLGLVGWISYWCLGDSVLTVDILVALINTLGVTELVSDALANRTPYRFSMQGHHVMFSFYVSWCTEALCEEVVQLLVHDMLTCVWSRTRIQLLWTKSHGARLYVHQADLLDRRRIYCHIIIRDSES
jgi:hypothetical protein